MFPGGNPASFYFYQYGVDKSYYRDQEATEGTDPTSPDQSLVLNSALSPYEMRVVAEMWVRGLVRRIVDEGR